MSPAHRGGRLAMFAPVGVLPVLLLTGSTPHAGPHPGFQTAIWAVSLIAVACLVAFLEARRSRAARDLHGARETAYKMTSKLIGTLDPSTDAHSGRVAERAAEVARALRLAEAEVEDIRAGAWLHDIGDIQECAEVLRQALGMTPEELEEIGHEQDIGRRPRGPVENLVVAVVPMVACLGERWDGGGYRGLQGDEIPLGARIIAAVDAYDEMVGEASHGEGMSPAEATAALRKESGTRFDPRVIDAFVRLGARTASRKDRAA